MRTVLRRVIPSKKNQTALNDFGTKGRVGSRLTTTTPPRSGRADFPHPAPHGQFNIYIYLVWFRFQTLLAPVCNRLYPTDKPCPCTVLPYSGITRYHRYYDGIRLPRYRLVSSVCGVVRHTPPCVRERRGSPELLPTHCTSCTALRPRGDTRSLALSLTVMLPSVPSNPSARPFLVFVAQSLFMPDAWLSTLKPPRYRGRSMTRYQ